MTTEQLYRMSISLNVLNHLGIGLYSNIPAVLSEVVANAWDADATEVSIDIDTTNGQIIIRDNGNGMNKEDINNKYLMVGYSKRTVEPGKTKKGRDPMGRKGIGKLSVFSIADVIDVYSVKGGERNGLTMSSVAIKERIDNGSGGEYYPSPLDVSNIDFDHGTKIVLKQVKRTLWTTETFLRKRLARRFSVIGAKHDFKVSINGTEISVKDRDFYDSLEFLWYIGPESADVEQECKNLKRAIQVSNIVDARLGYTASGWIGTVDEARNDEDQNNTIVVFAHGKLIQEDILGDFKEGGIYSKYLIGEINADFMDLNEKEDIVTSDRQKVKEDDERYIALKTFIREILKRIQNEWTPLRQQEGTKRALLQPVIKSWYDQLKGDNKRTAERLFGKIESLKLPDKEAKKELYKSSMLAFEKLALTNALSILEGLETEHDFELLANIFRDIDELEAVHYYQIVKGRIQVVREFQRILPAARERVLQQHIFDHLWLLDPSWERASSNLRIEESVTTEFAKINANLTDDEKAGRIDIRYRTAAGKHIIIELKKYDRRVTATELVDQVRKYRNALAKCLRTKFPAESQTIECICIIGQPPDDDEAENVNILRSVGARYITYDTLIQQTLKSYDEYLKSEKEVSRLISIIDELDRNFL